ncbi:MAG: TetR family transcriptional regulator [Micromonosporaceae bacterium]|nr:TetR family transcriptional regulator [Micromonosporaceae bacterium]
MTAGTAARRSDATRAAILAAARRRFAADGYERATIRAIAADADIDPAMVMRYYGSKERLFAAAAEFDLRLPDPAQLSRSGYGRALVRHFLERWEEDGTFVALLRAAVTNDAARDQMRDVFAGQIIPLVAAAAPADRRVAHRAGLVASQMIGLAMTRYVLALPPIARMSRDDVVAWIAPVLQRYLTRPAPPSTADS